MSRSYRKTAGYSKKDTDTKKMFNRSLRRKARQAELFEEADEEVVDYWFNYEVGNGKEFRKHNCTWDIRDYHGLWKGGYQEYKARLAYWENLYPDYPDFWADKWYKEIAK